ncbi:MAG: putative adenylyl-sulfate kinase [Verrucomicrobia subdivision 3 bacterium]|nr:putative adenylyl-sulfate kinase [Limisphaerales bacterium]MCS1414186.1 putative adenylyl-sulfate kinase [Limisphaerales bacterium]
MNAAKSNIRPMFQHMLPRERKESLVNQHGLVVWLYGLSGSGKSTIAVGLETKLHEQGVLTQLLDGDNIRTGLNKNLGFSDEDRKENIRRIAEVAKLHIGIGIVTIVSFITPKLELRQMARQIIGASDYMEVHVSCSYETCEKRDVKGLYAKAKSGNLSQFTGKDSSFEDPDEKHPSEITIHTDQELPEDSVRKLYCAVFPRTRFSL